MTKYTPKATEVDAVQWLPNHANTIDILTTYFEHVQEYDRGPSAPYIKLVTHEGIVTVRPNDFIAVDSEGRRFVRKQTDFIAAFNPKDPPPDPLSASAEPSP